VQTLNLLLIKRCWKTSNNIIWGKWIIYRTWYSWGFSHYNMSIHWQVHCHMKSNNETVSRQMPWAGNIVKTMTSNGKQFTVTLEMLTAVALHLSIKWSFIFHGFDPFALLYNKSLNDRSLEKQWILFPSNLSVSLDFVSGNGEILRKQNSLFPSGQVIKCLLLYLLVHILWLVHLAVHTLLYSPLKLKVGFVAKLFCDISPILNFYSKQKFKTMFYS